MPPASNHTLEATKKRILERMRTNATAPSKEELTSLKQKDDKEFFRLGDMARRFNEDPERLNRQINMSTFLSLGWTNDRPPLAPMRKRRIRHSSVDGGTANEAGPSPSPAELIQHPPKRQQNQVGSRPRKIVYPDAQKFSISLEDDEEEQKLVQRRALPYKETEVPVGVCQADPGHVSAKRMVVMTFDQTEGFLVAKPVPINIIGEHIEVASQDIGSYRVTASTLKGIKLINETNLVGRAVDDTLILDLAKYVWAKIPEKTRETWPWLSATDAIRTGPKFRKMEASLAKGCETLKFVDFSEVSERSAVRIALRMATYGASNQTTRKSYDYFQEQLKAGNDGTIKKAAEQYVNVMAGNHLRQLLQIFHNRANDEQIEMPIEMPVAKKIEYGLTQAGTDSRRPATRSGKVTAGGSCGGL
ncbi:hypothetical protein DV735_g4821, partial [Chaetothyriales sp. CBS 134920]